MALASACLLLVWAISKTSPFKHAEPINRFLRRLLISSRKIRGSATTSAPPDLENTARVSVFDIDTNL